MTAIRNLFLVCALTSLMSGCGNGKADMSESRLEKMAGGSLEKVVPASGIVTIDGEPQGGVNVYLYDKTPTIVLKNCRTDDEGQFCFTSYLSCDGLKPGEYKLGFEYVPKMKKNGTGVDLFNGKYKNPVKNDFKLIVEEDNPQTELTYELKLK
ncbi:MULTISPECIES: hypothetical protein [unclassified Schlesneria]|uniref:hypothetical protein n=1 Tax=unclassified Schlesneria TaxID=2762017 RepID=UPI002EDF7EFA